MSAHNHHISSIIISFSTFLENQTIATTTAEDAVLLLVDFLRQKKTLDRWEAPEVRAYVAQVHTAGSHTYPPEAVQLVTQFVDRFPPYQANVFLHEFVLALKSDGCSPATIKNYRSDINQFIQFAGEYELTKLLAKPKIEDFLRYEKEKGLKTDSVKRKLVSISQFVLWGQKQGLLTQTELWLTELNQNAETLIAQVDAGDSLTKNNAVDNRATSETSASTDQRTWSLPTATPLSPKNVSAWHNSQSARDRQDYRARLQAGLSGLTQKVTQETRRHLLPYLNLLMIALFFLGASYLGWKQFGPDAPQPFAYPSALTRPNRTLSFQGRLTDTSQNPIYTSTNLEFKLYDTGPGSGGVELWDSGTCAITPDQDGIFTTGLGDDCGDEIDADVFTENSNVWLEVTVGAETLAPRQQIKTVAYALNSETLQGYPASASAVENTVLVMDNSGEVVLGNTNPVLRATGTSFAIEAETLTLRTAAGSNGNVVLDPDGTGITQALSDLVATGYFAAPGATLSATYAGGTALVAKGGPTGTANIQEWQNSGGTPLSVVDEAGNFGVGTNNPGYKLDVAGGANLSSGNAYTINGTSVLNASTLGSGVTGSSLTSVGTLTSGTWNANTIGPTYGGTGIATYSTGDLIYASGVNTLAKRTIGSTDQVLTVVGGVPTWADPGAAGSVAWDNITAPTTADLTLAMSTYTTQFNWATGTGTDDLFSFTTDASANGTGSLVNIQTGASATVAPLRVRAGAAEALFVKNDGNVGVGTTTPGTTLDVTGTGRFSSTLTANTFVSSGVTITGGTINNTTIGVSTPATGNFTSIGVTTQGSGAFTTLTSSGNTTLATGASTTNTFGSGASSVNTIGSTTTPGALTLHGATTLDNTLTVSGSNLTTLGGNLTVTGTAWTATPTISGLTTLTSGFDSNSASTVAGLTVDTNGNLTVSNGVLSVTAPSTTGTAGAIVANSLTTGTGLDVSSTSTAGGASGVSKLLNLSRSGANAQLAHTAYGLYSAVTTTNATSGTNIAGYFSASGATTANYGLLVAAGNVGIGDATPTYLLDVNGTGRFTGAVDLDADLELNSTLTDVNGAVGTSGQILSSTATGVDWIDAGTVGYQGWTVKDDDGDGYSIVSTNILNFTSSDSNVLTNLTGGDDTDETLDFSIRLLKDAVAGTGLTGGANDVLVGADSDVTFAVDQTYGFAWTGAQSWSNTADFNGNVSIADTNIAFDGATTTFTTTGAFTLTSGGTTTISSAATTALTIDSGTTGAMNIGTGANAKTITLGNATGATTVTIDTGTGGINLGDNANTKAIDIGGVTASGTDTISIATNATAADVIAIGNAHASTTLALTGGDDWSMSATGILTMSASAAQTTAIVITDTDYTNALSIGDNDITGTTFDLIGTTATINFTNFDVSSAGVVTAGTYNSQTISSAASFTGTVNAVTGYKVNGAATSGNYLRGNGTNFVSSAIQIGDLPTITTAGGWTDAGTTVHLTTDTDNVGIGTTAPTAKLSVVGDAIITGTDVAPAAGALKIVTGAETMYLGGNELDTVNDALYLQNNSTNHLILVNGGGNVGIGGTSTLQKLDVAGNIRLTGDFRTNAASYNFLTDAGAAVDGKFDGLQVSSSYSGTIPANGILFYTDSNLYRSAATTLRTNSSLITDLDLTVTGGDITLGTTSIFSGGDTASLNNIDAINGTTETTFEAALDSLVNLTAVGTITTGTWNATDISLAAGGTNASLTADAGGIVYSGASALAILADGASGYCLKSGGTGAPTWGLCSTGSVTGTGTDNYIPRWNGTAALENSIIYDDGTNVGIGDTTPSYKLDVTGDIRSTGLTYLGTSGFYAQYEYKTSASVAGAGWYRVAQIAGSAGRGQQQVTIYTTGGSYVPYSATFEWWHGYYTGSNAGVSVKSATGGGYWTDVRVTDDASNSYLEVYFTQAITTLSIGLQYIGGHDLGTINSGALSAGGGTVIMTTKANAVFAANDKLIVASNGSVGIGTTAPGAKLEVNGGNADVLAQITAGTDTFDSRLALAESSNYGMYLEYDGTANIGYLGMADNVAPNAAWSKRIQMSRTGTEVAFMAGSVGIGTTNPSQALDIVGNAEINGNEVYVGHPSSYSRFNATSIAGQWSYLRLNNGSNLFDIATLSTDTSGALQFRPGGAATYRTTMSTTGDWSMVGDLTVTGGDITLGTTSIFSGGDTASLNNIDAINGTTETTFEAALDSLVNLTAVGTITTGTWNATDISLAAGGTNASLTAVNGGIVYSTASAMAISAAGTSGYCLKSGGAGAPTWGLCSTGSVTGSGTDNYIPRWNGTTALENSVMYDDGTNVGIGTTAPDRKLHVYQGDSGATGYALTGGIDIDSTSTTGINILSPNTGYGRIYFGAPISNTAGSVEYIHSATLASGYMKLRAGDVDTLFLKNGNVGIGTAAPGAIFDVSNATPVVRITDTTSSDAWALNTTLGALEFYTTDATAPGARVIASIAQLTDYNGGHTVPRGALQFNVSTTGAVSEAMRIASNGNVGVGIAAPTQKLDVRSTATSMAINVGDTTQTQYSDIVLTSSSGNGQIFKAGGSYASYGGAGSLNIYNSQDTPITFYQGASERMRVAAGGNVGIGTTAPDYKLHIKDGTGGAQLKLQRGTGIVTFDQGNNLDNLYVYADNGIFLNPTAGNVGIGTTAPGAKLDVNSGSIRAHGAAGGEGRVMMLLDGNDQFEWYPQSTGLLLYNRGVDGGGGGNAGYKLSILNGGNVGIGTTAPLSQFEVIADGSTLGVADNFGTAGNFEGATPTGQTSTVSLAGNDTTLAANIGGVLGFGGKYSGAHTYANWASIKGLKTNATSGDYSGYLSFFTRLTGAGSVERMRIDNTGNVGIGTTAPSKRLDLAGKTVVGILGGENNNVAGQGMFKYPAGTAVIQTLPDSFNGNIRGLKWTGNYYLWTDYSAEVVHRMASDGTEIDTFAISSAVSPHGMAWDGRYFWTIDSGASCTMRQFDLEYGPVRTIVPTDWSGLGVSGCYGLEFAGGRLYFANNNDDYLYGYDIETGTLETVTSLTSYFTGGVQAIAYDGQYLYLGTNSNTTIHVFKPTSGSPTYVRAITGVTGGAIDMTWNGDNLVFARHDTANLYLLENEKTILDGNVGIGTTAPNEKLEVSGGNIRTNGTIKVYNGATQMGELTTSDTTWFRINQSIAKNIYTPQYFRADGGLYVDSTSYGISGSGILLNGSLSGTYSNALTLSSVSNAFTGASISISGNSFLSTSSGNVGVGTTTPGAKLGVLYSDPYSTDVVAKITANKSLAVVGGKMLQITNAGGQAVEYGIYQDGAITQNYFGGSVGIGFTAPASKLDVDTASNTTGLRLRGLAETLELADFFVGSGGELVLTTRNTGDSTAYIELDGEDDTYGLVLRDSNTGSSVYSNLYMTDAAVDYLNIVVNLGTSTAGLVVTDNDFVGIGTTAPGEALDVRGDVVVPNTGSTFRVGSADSAGLYYSNGSNDLYVGGNNGQAGNINIKNSAGTITASINSDNYTYFNIGVGGVGIGMTNPSVALDVTGDIEYTGIITDVSDVRLKENFAPVTNPLTKILALDSYQFNMIGQSADKIELGYKAQAIQLVIPELVTVIDPNNGYLGVNYIGFIPIITEAIKEQQAMIQRLSTTGELTITSTGEIAIAGQTANYAVTQTGNTSPITKIAVLAESVIGKVRAGLITTKDLVVTQAATVQSLVVTQAVTARDIVVEQTAQITSLSVNSLTIGGQTIQTYVENLIATALQNTTQELISPIANIESLTAKTATVSGTLQAGSVNTGTLATGALTTTELVATQATVSGLTATGTSKLGSLLADNATIAGVLQAESITTTELTATSARVTALEAGMAQLEEVRAQVAELTDLKSTNFEATNATISGTLYAQNIHNLDQQVAAALKQPTLLELLLNQTPTNPAPPADVIATVESVGYSATDSASLRRTLADLQLDSTSVVLETDALFVRQYLEVNGLAYVSDQLSVGNRLAIGDGLTLSSGVLAYEPALENLSDTLFQIQPAGRGTLSLMAGLMTLDETGQVVITGNLAVAGDIKTEGTLLTDLLKPTDYGSPLQVQVAGVATESGVVTESRFEIINELQSPVATISAKGKADFAAGVGVAADDLSAPTATQSALLTSDKTAGKASIPANTASVTIAASALTESSLIYVTPLGSTQNQSLYIKEQQADNPLTPSNEAQFVVGFDAPTTQPVSFTWWIVN